MTWIDSKEAAKLMCITLQAVNKAAKEGKYGDQIRYIKGRGGSGRILQVALEALPEEAQIKRQSDKENIYVQLSLPLDFYSAKKRTESASKLMIINEYKEFVEKNISCKNESKNPSKQFVDAWNTIHPEQMISTRSLYRWISRLEKTGMEGLIDKRGAWNKGISSIPEEIWRLFKYYYLDENKPSLKSCYDRVHVTAIEKVISLPSVSAFERMAHNIPKPVLVRWRDGAKAFEDLCMPYISRDYTSFKSNQIWVTDHHIFDQFVVERRNKLMRPWGSYFEDMRSRLIVASYLFKFASRFMVLY